MKLCTFLPRRGGARLAGVAFGLAAPFSHALEWTYRQQAVDATPARVVVVAFPFRNGGDRPTTITSVVASCECLKTHASRERLAPGESGTLTVEVGTERLRGSKEALISVITDRDFQHPAILSVKVTATDEVSVSPRLVFWSQHEAPEPKYIDVTAKSGSFAVDRAVPTNPAFRAEVATASPQGVRIRITPRTTDEIIQGGVDVTTVVAGERRRFLVYVAVRSAIQSNLLPDDAPGPIRP
jgi:hypothetical protein